jgi:Protein of unknown function (DUF2442)
LAAARRAEARSHRAVEIGCSRNHSIYRVCSFEIVSAYTVRIRFDDGAEQTIDFRPILAGELYSSLRDLELFNQVRIDPELQTLVWPNGADFDPATLHDWPGYEHAFRELALRWDPVHLTN